VDEETKVQNRRAYAVKMIKANQYVVCICGALFHNPDGYVEHVASCGTIARSEAAAGRHGKG
jgi:hypothetical protein